MKGGVTAGMRTIKVSVSLPEELVLEMKRLAPNLSAFVTEGMRRHVMRVRTEQALRGSAGAWESGEHPDLADLDDVERYVDVVRSRWEWREA